MLANLISIGNGESLINMERGRRACESKEHRKLSTPANLKSQLFGSHNSTRIIMKKLLLTLTLLGITVVCHAQGTIIWGNGMPTRIMIVPI